MGSLAALMANNMSVQDNPHTLHKDNKLCLKWQVKVYQK